MAKAKDGNLLLTVLSLAANVLLIPALIFAFLAYKSQLALAQGADSLSDVFMSSVLIVGVVVARRPRDTNHPFGHERAEPLGALVAAMMAGVLAVTVLRSAIESLIEGPKATLDWPLAVIFAVKLLAKIGIFAAASRQLRQAASPTMSALRVDSRNDALANSLSLAGFAAAKYGWPALDAWLALPAALWIGYSGLRLALDNIRLLMGEAPPALRQQELLRLAAGIEGVRDAHDLRAQYIGPSLQVHLHIKVDSGLSVGVGHDIGEAVRQRLEAEPDVSHVSVHVDSA